MSALRTRQKASFTLPIPPDQAFDLFTAEGERHWVDGWEPVFLSDCGALEPGAVFLTDHGGEQTIWTVIEADRPAGRLLYSRVSPARRAGTVGVKLADEDGGTRVHVAYDITALGSEGETAVAAMDSAGFAAMVAEWRQLIERSVMKTPATKPAA